MCVPQNYILKKFSKEDKAQLSSVVINKIRPVYLKNGMWCIHSKSGYSGQIRRLSQRRTGKHGHCKVYYELVLPHNNSIEKEFYHARQEVTQAFVAKEEYLVSHFITHNMIVRGFVGSDDELRKLHIPQDMLDLIYLFYHDYDIKQVVCYDNNFNELWFPIINDKNNKKTHDKLMECFDCALNSNNCKNCYITIKDFPVVSMKNEEDVEILQMITDSKVIDPY